MTTAGYRFIPIEPDLVVAPPIPFTELDLAKPNAAGSVSGTLTVRWTAETPVCVGGRKIELAGGGASIEAVKFGGDYCLPGSTLRGMVRSVLEIATLSHLGRINADRQHGVRSFDMDDMPDRFRHRVMDLKAGWLSWSQQDGWQLTEATDEKGSAGGFRLIRCEELLGKLPKAPTANQWKGLLLQDKMAKLETAGLAGLIRCLDAGEYDARNQPGRRLARLPTTQSTYTDQYPGDSYRCFVVCAGSADATATKKNEAVIGPPNPKKQHPLPQALMDTFHRLQANPGKGKQDPRGNWRYWLFRLGYDQAFKVERKKDNSDPTPFPSGTYPGIPIFYCGDPARAGREKPNDPRQFFFGLTRVLHYPWKHSVGDVARRLYPASAAKTYRIPALDDPKGWDFARAMFGEVEDRTMHDLSKAKPGPDGEPEAKALAGRVAFGPAFALRNPPPGKTERGVLGQPRESFYPFYLANEKGGGGSYEDSQSVIAGRKRYVTRKEPAKLAKGNDNESTYSTICFLPAGTAFAGNIRFHNLHPIELGALLFALTFGQPGGAFRHMVGRAKGFGYGVLRAEVALTPQPVERNIASGDRQHVDAAGGPTKPEGWIACFDAHMRMAVEAAAKATGQARKASAYERTIAQLRKFADPAVGARNVAALTYGSLDQYQDWKTEYPANTPRSRRSLLSDLDD